MLDTFRCIVAGGRDFNDYECVVRSLVYAFSKLHVPVTIICGKARGADALGERYAKERGLNIMYFPADWDHLGKRAGYVRNEEMAKNADALVAFWNGQSRGTKHMIETAQRHNLPVKVVRYRFG